MIHSLRQYHRRTFMALGVFLPVAFILGITVRKPLPAMEATPAASSSGSCKKFTVTEWQRPGLFPKSPVQTSLLRASANGGGWALSFVAARDFVQPDLLVYGVPGDVAVTDTLPGDAVLLGGFSSPASAAARCAGRHEWRKVIILYSSGQRRDRGCVTPDPVQQPGEMIS